MSQIWPTRSAMRKASRSGYLRWTSQYVQPWRKFSVYYVGDREDARSFLGFKHINGPAKWDAYAKARFAAEWYDTSRGTSLSEIAKAIGDRHDTIKRMVSAIFVLDQAQQNNLFRRRRPSCTEVQFLASLYCTRTITIHGLSWLGIQLG